MNVCEKRGCWIELAGDKENTKIRVKVEDGVIVFPMEAKGKTALVEGELYSIIVEGGGCESECGDKEGDDHENEEKESCASKKQVKKVYMLKGIGAEIS